MKARTHHGQLVSSILQAGLIKTLNPQFLVSPLDRHGLIMGCSVTGTKKTAGAAKLVMGPKPLETREENKSGPKNSLSNILRLLLGTTAGFYYFLVPVPSPPSPLLRL